MTKVVLLRHGATQGNLRGAYLGAMDEPLCREGIDRIAANSPYPKVERVFCSPMERCRQTAALAYPGRETKLAEGLRERCFGELEGLCHSEITALPGMERWGMSPEEMPFPGGEELQDFRRRAEAAFLDVMGQAGKSAALVTHGGVIMAVLAAFCTEKKDFYSYRCPPGGGFLACWHEGRLAVEERLER